MSKHTEIELKLRCTDESQWGKIFTAESLAEITVPGTEVCQLLDARYFDTSTYCLQNAKLAYRIRREGEQWIATIKGGGTSKGGLHERQEWNIVVSHDQPDLAVFSHTDIGQQLIEIVGGQQLKPIVITKFERRSVQVMAPDGSHIELAADQGTIVAGSKETTILEVELELITGNSAALFKLGAELAKEVPLLPETDSKFYRGLQLLGLGKLQTQKTGKGLPLDKNQLVSEGFRNIVIQLIVQFLATQRHFLENQAQPEDVHDLRVCLRRLRSLLHIAGPVVLEQYKWYQDELRKLGQLLGLLREIDVAYAGWQAMDHCRLAPLENKISLGELLAKHRLLEGEKAYKTFYAGIATPLVLELWAAIINPSQQLPQQHSTVQDYVTDKLSQGLKAVMRQGKTINWTELEKAHKLRLQIKKIKYVAEVFEPIINEFSQLVLRLDVLQDHLGLINDAYSTEALLKIILKANSGKTLYLEAGMVIGWQRREVLFAQGKMNKHWKVFYRTAQRWV